MTKEKFIKYLDEKMDICDDNPYDDEVEVIYSSRYCYFIKVEVLSNSTMNVYCEFLYEEHEKQYKHRCREVEEESFFEGLEEEFSKKPCAYDDFGFCPFVEMRVGYFGEPLDTKIISRFIAVYAQVQKSQVVEDKVRNIILDSVKDFLLPMGWKDMNDAIVSPQKDIIIAISKNNSLFKSLKLNKFELLDNEKSYHGAGYIIFQNKAEENLLVDSEVWKIIEEVTEEFDFDYMPFISTDSKRALLYDFGNIFLVTTLVDDNSAIERERKLLYSKVERLKKIAPDIELPKLCFDHLSKEDFQNFCMDFLVRKGFESVSSNGHLNAGDGGIDLFAEQVVKDILDGDERRKWIWQCKHSKTPIDRKDISEISDLLSERNASAYGLITTCRFTPDAIRRLQDYRERKKIRLRYYAASELRVELENMPELIKKYKLYG